MTRINLAKAKGRWFFSTFLALTILVLATGLSGCALHENRHPEEEIVPGAIISNNGDPISISFKGNGKTREISFYIITNNWNWLIGSKVYKIEYKDASPDFPFLKFYFYRGNNILADPDFLYDYYWRMTIHNISIGENEMGVLAFKKDGQWEKYPAKPELVAYFFKLGDRLANYDNDKHPFSDCFKSDVTELMQVCKKNINHLADQ